MENVRLVGEEGDLGSYEVLSTWWSRLRGLLGKGGGRRQVMLARCGSIHTYGMGFPIDVAFVGRDGRVLLSCRDVGPGARISMAGAMSVLERPTRTLPWPRTGELLLFDRGELGGGA